MEWHNKVVQFRLVAHISHIEQNVQHYHFPELGVLGGHIHDEPTPHEYFAHRIILGFGYLLKVWEQRVAGPGVRSTSTRFLSMMRASTLYTGVLLTITRTDRCNDVAKRDSMLDHQSAGSVCFKYIYIYIYIYSLNNGSNLNVQMYGTM